MQPFDFLDLTDATMHELFALSALGAALDDPFDTTGAHAALDELQAYPTVWGQTLRMWADDQYRTEDDMSWLADVSHAHDSADAIDAMLEDMAPNY
jgi:hypothetical protein|tara:strand:+ start:26 stop:313 length:288 start_codon:yes stop_codon:yes gene_type:complete